MTELVLSMTCCSDAFVGGARHDAFSMQQEGLSEQFVRVLQRTMLHLIAGNPSEGQLPIILTDRVKNAMFWYGERGLYEDIAGIAKPAWFFIERALHCKDGSVETLLELSEPAPSKCI